MSDIPAGLRSSVVQRAGNRCEYCALAQVGQEAAFHIDHVIPRALAGPTTEDNLALACVSCSLRKGAQRDAVDPESGAMVPVFNPRTQVWADHFQWNGEVAIARTATGRATIALLAINRPLIIEIRREERERGRHPPH
jgi:hypothetical protein